MFPVIFGMRELIEKNWEYGKEFPMVFTDYKESTDNVKREEIWKSLGGRRGRTELQQTS
jgi:hypothetical protein